jgi:AsmA-like C-terminal region/AsmA family
LKKALKISLRVLSVLLAIILLAFAGGWIYLKQHKKEVISFLESEAKKSLNGGALHIADINIGFRHTFPRIAFTIDSLTLQDSLWKQHHHNLISATRVYATLDFFKLIIGKINIGRVQLESPHIYLYTDSTGYSNTSLFKKNSPPKKDAPKNPEYPILEISDGTLSVDKEDVHKFFGFDIPSLECHIRGGTDNPVLTIDASLDCKVQRMTFNPEKGPFLQGKTVVGEFQFHFNSASKVLQFEKIKLDVDQQPFIFTGKFFLAEVPTPFILSWETENLSFRKAASFLSDNIRLKLDQYDIIHTITHLTGSMDNSEPEFKTPLIHLKLNVENKGIVTPVVIFNNASFVATFNNEAVRGYGHEDSNTVMHFTSFKGNWDKLDFQCDSIVIHDLIHPRMKMHLVSNLKLENINGLIDETTLAFTKGSGKIDLIYNGSLEKSYDSLRMIYGTFNMDSAGFLYVPRNLQFTNGKGVIRFQNKDILVDNLNLYTGNTDLVMNGKIKSIFYLINQRNNKLTIDWTIHSNKLNLNDFTSFLKQKQARVVIAKKKSSLAQTVTQFTAILKTANFNLDLNAKQLLYKKFNAENLTANLAMDDNAINLKSIRLQHANGSILMNGMLRNNGALNPFDFKAQLKNIDVTKIFYAFNNFGLKSPTDKNISGTLTADVTMQGGLTTKALLIPESLKGFVKFNLHNGQLINFEPVQKIQQTVFKSRNFSDIQFADLHDLLEINGNNITINRMEIRSTVLTMFVEGIYNMKTGPVLSIQVPLSNLKANKDSVLINKGINSKTGVSARLRAQKGEDGKIKITWDPFNKAGKEMKKAQSLKPKA